jgi:hypothetical protein
MDLKMRVTSGPWDIEKLILRDRALEGRNLQGGCMSRESRCTTTRGARRLSLRAPYGISSLTLRVIDHSGPALHVTGDVIDHNGPMSDHANPVIDHYALSGALSPSITDTVSADADLVSADGGTVSRRDPQHCAQALDGGFAANVEPRPH